MITILAKQVSRLCSIRYHSGVTMIESREILDILPHRYPMLPVDHVLDIEDGKRIVPDLA